MNAPTPTTNPELRFRVDGFATLSPASTMPPRVSRASTSLVPGRPRDRPALSRAAPPRRGPRRAARRLWRRARRPWQSWPRRPRFVTVFFACQYAGWCRCPCPCASTSAATTPMSSGCAACSPRLGHGSPWLRRTSGHPGRGRRGHRRYPRHHCGRDRDLARRRRAGGALAQTSPATSSTLPAARASPVASWSRSAPSRPTHARSRPTGCCAAMTAAPPGCRSITTWAWSAAASRR